MPAEIRNGLVFKYEGQLYSVVSFQHVKQGRGAAFMRVKMRSILTGRVVENSFGGDDKFDDVRIEHRVFQYLYPEADDLVLMDNETFEQINVKRVACEGVDFLVEGESVKVLWNTETELPLIVEVPASVVAKVEYTEPGVKGDTATNTMKPATLESGAEVRVPLFINIGDVIKVDTATKMYIERVKA